MKKISNLLSGAMDRGGFKRGVCAAQAVTKANEWIESSIPESHRDEACAVSLRDERLIIACTSSAIASFVRDREEQCLDYVLRGVPNAPLKTINTRLVSELAQHEF